MCDLNEYIVKLLCNADAIAVTPAAAAAAAVHHHTLSLCYMAANYW